MPCQRPTRPECAPVRPFPRTPGRKWAQNTLPGPPWPWPRGLPRADPGRGASMPGGSGRGCAQTRPGQAPVPLPARAPTSSVRPPARRPRRQPQAGTNRPTACIASKTSRAVSSTRNRHESTPELAYCAATDQTGKMPWMKKPHRIRKWMQDNMNWRRREQEGFRRGLTPE